MATKKQKRLAGIAKREAEEAERRERGLHFLKLAQDERREKKAEAEKARKDRAIAKSQKLAQQHRAKKAAEMSKPGLHKVATSGRTQNSSGASGRRKKFNKAKNPKRGPRMNGTDQAEAS